MASAAYIVSVRVGDGPGAAGRAAERAAGPAGGVSVERLLRAFYQPVFDLARLAQASALEASLDPAADVAEGRDRWRRCCELPTLLEKLWADLYELRRGVPAGERRARAAPAALVEGCLHVHARLGEAVAVVSQALAVRFLGRLVALGGVAAGGAVAAQWARGDARAALALHFAGQMREGWARSGP